LADKKLTLTNDGQLSLFFVGVGSAFSKRHYQTNLLIIKGNDHLMIDCGTRTPQALYELGLSVAQITNYYVTHSHADHTGGLEEVMLVSRYSTKIKPNIWITPGYQSTLWDLTLRGGSGFNEFNGGANLSFADMWTVHPLRWLPNSRRETYEFEVGSLKLKVFRTKHIPGTAATWEDSFWSTGLVIDDRVLFSGDTRFDPSLLDEYATEGQIETIYHDCQFFPPGGVHASIDELKTLPQALKEKMLLVHYGDDWDIQSSKVADLGFSGLARQWVYYDFPNLPNS
jgi:ribonuclease BN (tRNA processing enzyme)